MSSNTATPGWYPDPAGDGQLRWWDGSVWTAQTQVLPPPSSSWIAPPPPPSSPTASRPATEGPARPQHRGFFGARHRVEDENEQLRRTLADLGVSERDQLRQQIGTLQAERAAIVADRDALVASVGELQEGIDAREGLRDQIAGLRATLAALDAERTEVQAALVETRDSVILQEVGVYEYRHRLADSVAYKDRLASLRLAIKSSIKHGSAVKGATNFTLNGSTREGAKMVQEFSKLMLRAYNNEADSAVHTMKPYALDSAIARLTKAKDTIVRLGRTMNLRVDDSYHGLRIHELELTADYLAKIAEEKEAEAQKRERMRDEAKAQREIQREQERLRKEQAHYLAALSALRARGDHAAAAQTEAKLSELEDSLAGINRRAANLRAGWVYVISNIGSFGERMVKVGMTRRLDPLERVRELGDASVPFRYDVHAVVSSDDAVSLETNLHRALADKRVNAVNRRREFFYATPTEVREVLERMESTLVSYTEQPEALEWRQSETMRRLGNIGPEMDESGETIEVLHELDGDA